MWTVRNRRTCDRMDVVLDLPVSLVEPAADILASEGYQRFRASLAFKFGYQWSQVQDLAEERDPAVGRLVVDHHFERSDMIHGS